MNEDSMDRHNTAGYPTVERSVDEYPVDEPNAGEFPAEKFNVEESPTEEHPADKDKRSMLKEILGWIATIVVAVLVAKLINEKVIIKAEVPTGSMENTIMTGDCVLGFQLAYLFSEPKRGDIVIFPWPDNQEVTYVKRIIGLPGETLEVKDGAVYINGEALHEDYLKEEMLGTYGPYEIPEGCYFMMGDNRNPSSDSRKWHNTFLKREDIIAKVIFRYSPNFTWYSTVEYD